MCCGKNRAQLKSATSKPVIAANVYRNRTSPATDNAQSPIANAMVTQSLSALANGVQVLPARVQQRNISFAYIGNTKMTVIGPATGFQYSFDRPGARLYVDPRDRAALAAIRQLRQVR